MESFSKNINEEGHLIITKYDRTKKYHEFIMFRAEIEDGGKVQQIWNSLQVYLIDEGYIADPTES